MRICLAVADLSEVSRSARSYGSEHLITVVVAIVCALAVLAVVLIVVDRFQRSLPQMSTAPKLSLMDEIADGHQLTPGEREILDSMARSNQLSMPEILVIDPTLWQPCLEQTDWKPEQVAPLMAKLFGVEVVRKHLG